MRRFKIFLASLAMLAGVLAIAQPAYAANVFSGACGTGSGSSAVCAKQSTSNPLTGSKGLIQKVTRIIAIIAGLAAVIVILVGGIMYITSGGDAGKVSSAKNTIIYAVVGLVIIVMAQAIIGFVISKL
jgi:hypothetical protein